METWVEGEISWTCCWQPPAQAEVQSLNDRGVEGHYRGHTLANNGRGEHDRSQLIHHQGGIGFAGLPGWLAGIVQEGFPGHAISAVGVGRAPALVP